MKVAIVHDGLATHGGAGGAEWVLSVLHEIFPDAPIYTTVFNPKIMPEEFNNWDIRTSFIQKLPFAKTKYKLYLPLMPTAVEQFDLTSYDIVISCNHSVAKGIITRPDTLHICYCYSPLRYVWEFYYEYLKDEKFNPILKLFIPFIVNYLRLWDRLSADRVDYFIAISQNVAKRIYKHYRRDSIVIYPPIDVSKYTIKKNVDDFFLIVSRMVAYKRLDIAISAFNELKLPLVIIGDGIERNRLMKNAGKNIKFLGRQPDDVVRDYYSRCKAFIFTSEEDFGIAPLEAQASGRPVIAYSKGGALETVIDGITGKFYYDQTPQALIQAVREFNIHQFDPIKLRRHTLKFSIEIFKQKFKNFVKSKYAGMSKEPFLLKKSYSNGI